MNNSSKVYKAKLLCKLRDTKHACNICVKNGKYAKNQFARLRRGTC